MRDILEEIWATARRNKLRTVLTGFAVAWGIFMLIFLLGAGNGLINGMTNNMGNFMANAMDVYGGQTSKEYQGFKEGRDINLDDKDIQMTATRFPDNVETVGASIYQEESVISYGPNYVSNQITGVYPNEQMIRKVEMLAGRFINEIDNEQQRKVLVVNEDQAKELVQGDFHTLVGKYVKVGKFAFQVVGISKKLQSKMQNEAYTPFKTLRTMYGRGDKADQISFSFKGLETEAENEAFEKQYRAYANANHQAAADDEEAIWLWNHFTQSMQMNNGMRMVRTALWIVGIFTLLSGIVGVSNIMLISVKERTKEFGIRKAIGAKPWGILRLIIIESIIITTFFGYIGMLLGIFANQYMDATIGHQTIEVGTGRQITTFLNPTVGLDVCIGATILMVIAGTLAGLIPALKAARVKPIEALRAE